jgi:hypothetical protein
MPVANERFDLGGDAGVFVRAREVGQRYRQRLYGLVGQRGIG